MDSSVISFIVHLLFNVQAGVLQPAACSLSAKSVIVTITIVRAVTSITVRAIIVVLETGLRSVCSDHRHSRLELGCVAVVWTKRQPVQASGTARRAQFIIANPIRTSITMLGAFLPLLQPLFFLFRQHISLPRVVHAAAPLPNHVTGVPLGYGFIGITPFRGQLPRSAKERRRPTPT